MRPLLMTISGSSSVDMSKLDHVRQPAGRPQTRQRVTNLLFASQHLGVADGGRLQRLERRHRLTARTRFVTSMDSRPILAGPYAVSEPATILTPNLCARAIVSHRRGSM